MPVLSMVLSLVLLLVGAGCTTEPTRFYLLDAGAPAVGTENSGGILLGVRPVTLPEYLGRSEIVTRVTPHRLKIAIFDVWAEPLETNATNVLVDLLAERLPAGRVVLLADESAATDFNLSVDIERFERQPDGAVLLAAAWTVEDGESGAPELVDATSIREGVVGQGYDAIVGAMSRVLDRLSQEVAAKLDDWLINYCRETGETSVPRRVVQQRGPNSLRDQPALNDAIAELADADRARLVVDGKRKDIEVNPALLKVH